MYPNPVRGLLNIPQIGGRAAVYDLNGRLLADFQLTDAAYDASALAEGMYLLTVTDEAGTARQTRFVVRRD